MSEIPPQAIEQLKEQIHIIKNYAEAVDESQGLVASAINSLVSTEYAKALANSLNQIGMAINLILQRLPEEKPAIIVPR